MSNRQADPKMMLARRNLISQLSAGPKSSTELAAAFGLSRQAIHARLKELERRGEVRQTGNARATRWHRVFSHVFSWPLQGLSLAEHEMWREAQAAIASDLARMSEATIACLNYGVTEVINNAIDHSGGTEVSLSWRMDGLDVELVIADDGVGALQHIMTHFGLPSELDSIAHIAKGQQPTDPRRHSGQGLFFTSKLFEHFELDSGDHAWRVDNVRGDMAVGPGAGGHGTRVTLRINSQGDRRPKDVFDQFSDPDTYKIDRNRLRVSLADHGDHFMSRSEAKRLASGLDLYGEVELDFSGVREVGQGFVDELFRVWSIEHPGTKFSVVNASVNVDFMIRRGLPTS